VSEVVHAVLPAGVDDPARPSGGNTYDRRVCSGLAAAGWDVRELLVGGDWPQPDRVAFAQLADVVAAVPDDALVLIDGLIASAAADELVPATQRLRVVVLVHMPLGVTAGARRDVERDVLINAAAVVTTSGWTRDQLIERYRIDPKRIHVARPGVDVTEAADGTSKGGELLCVGAVAPHKAQDILVEALADVADLPWRCRLIGSLDRDPAFVAKLREAATALDGRVDFVGPLIGADLDRAYRTSDLLVLPSRGETYGMVVAEALAHAVPVLVTDVGGVREAIGDSGAGVLVPPDDPPALAAALREWLTDAHLRTTQRRAAADRRATLAGWPDTVRHMAAALVAAGAPIR
jgi:glycosyltransferase involved in cell wall biosynthesis